MGQEGREGRLRVQGREGREGERGGRRGKRDAEGEREKGKCPGHLAGPIALSLNLKRKYTQPLTVLFLKRPYASTVLSNIERKKERKKDRKKGKEVEGGHHV